MVGDRPLLLEEDGDTLDDEDEDGGDTLLDDEEEDPGGTELELELEEGIKLFG